MFLASLSDESACQRYIVKVGIALQRGLERIIKASSNPGDVVLDPFLGSGSLIEAALRTGRVGIGFEINPAYVKIASGRINRFLVKQAETQGTLF